MEQIEFCETRQAVENPELTNDVVPQTSTSSRPKRDAKKT
jgi:hypothetical protein